MVQSGYDAFMHWNGILNKKVGHRQPNYSALYILWILKIVEYIFYLFIDLYYAIYASMIYYYYTNTTTSIRKNIVNKK